PGRPPRPHNTSPQCGRRGSPRPSTPLTHRWGTVTARLRPRHAVRSCFPRRRGLPPAVLHTPREGGTARNRVCSSLRLSVLVETAPGLTTEQSRLDHTGQEWRRSVQRLLDL